MATPAGIAALGVDYEPLLTGTALRERVLRQLPEGERRILECLIGHYPNAVERQHIETRRAINAPAATPISSASVLVSWWRRAAVRSRPRITCSIEACQVPMVTLPSSP